MSDAASASVTSSSASTVAAGTTNTPPEHQQGGGGSGLSAERKGRFRVKQVEAAEAEEASYPEGDILGGRIKGFDRPHSSSSHHQHQHETSASSAPPSHLSSQRMGTVDMSTVSDLTDSLGKSSKMGGGKERALHRSRAPRNSNGRLRGEWCPSDGRIRSIYPCSSYGSAPA